MAYTALVDVECSKYGVLQDAVFLQKVEVVPCTGEHARRCCAAWYVECMMHGCLGWWFFLLLGFVSGTLI